MASAAYNFKQLSRDVDDTLRSAFGPNIAIQLDEGMMGQVFARIVSDKFNGIDQEAKQSMVWDELRRAMQSDAQGVALVLVFGTEDL